MFWPIFIAACGFWGFVLAGGFYLGRRYVRALERLADTNERLARLQESVNALTAAAAALPQIGGGGPAEPSEPSPRADRPPSRPA